MGEKELYRLYCQCLQSGSFLKNMEIDAFLFELRRQKSVDLGWFMQVLSVVISAFNQFPFLNTTQLVMLWNVLQSVACLFHSFIPMSDRVNILAILTNWMTLMWDLLIIYETILCLFDMCVCSVFIYNHVCMHICIYAGVDTPVFTGFWYLLWLFSFSF